MADDDTQKTDDQKPDDKPDDKSTDDKNSPKTFDETYVKGLRSESAGYRTRATSAEKERDDLKVKVEEFEKTAGGAEGRILTAETTLLKFRVAAEKGLPLDLAERLVGSTREEIEADAAVLAKKISPSTDYDQGNKNKPPADSPSPSDAIRRLARKN